jgi:hypothetical protein
MPARAEAVPTMRAAAQGGRINAIARTADAVRAPAVIKPRSAAPPKRTADRTTPSDHDPFRTALAGMQAVGCCSYRRITNAVSVTALVVAQSVRFSASQAVRVASMTARPG